MADEGLQNEVLAYIHAGAGAAAAVERAAGIFAGRIRALDDDYLRERACDVLDACYRIVDVLDGPQAQMPPLNSPSILAAEELYPTDILSIDRRMILGLVMGAGSANAHASIIARTMGIPAVVLAGQEFLDVCDGKIAAINGSTGDLCLEPDEATKARFAHSIRRARRHTLTEERLRYVVASQTGPDHDKHFVVEVHLNSNCIGSGEGHSKKQAEQAAAKEALALMGY